MIALAYLVAVLQGPAPAADSAPDSLRYRNRVTAAPFLSYSEQTHWLFGAGIGWRFKTGAGQTDSLTRPSLFNGWTFVTTRGQWSVGASLSRYSYGNRWWFVTAAQGAFFPLDYYGIGPYTLVTDANRMQNHQLRVDLRLARRVAPHLHLGPLYRFQGYWNLHWSSPSRIPAGLPGGTGSVSSGVGLGLVYDPRNSLFTPTRGWFAEVDLLWHNEVVGSREEYATLILDGRRYVRLTHRGDLLALNLAAQFNGTDVPIQSMAMLSGLLPFQQVMRGVYLGRFRDRHVAVAQADLRLHLTGRWGVVLLGSAGNVFGTSTGLTDRIKTTWGGGIRFNLTPRDPLNIRLDYVRTSFGESGVSLGAAEAF